MGERSAGLAEQTLSRVRLLSSRANLESSCCPSIIFSGGDVEDADLLHIEVDCEKLFAGKSREDEACCFIRLLALHSP
ncbi:hypothetical protein HPB50_028429 [Hyalomma asiaticum]|nr:hypothetical protein HPB50_028429 [Hyalomma asiaticum]